MNMEGSSSGSPMEKNLPSRTLMNLKKLSCLNISVIGTSIASLGNLTCMDFTSLGKNLPKTSSVIPTFKGTDSNFKLIQGFIS